MDPARVLVKEVNWLGDIVMSLPALRAVRAAYPQAHLAVLIKQELASFFDGAAWINEVIPYRLGKGLLKRVSDRRGIAATLRAKNFDLAILFPNSFDSALWPFLARIPRRAGYARDARGLLLTAKTKPTPEILEVHQVYYYLHMLHETLGIAFPSPLRGEGGASAPGEGARGESGYPPPSSLPPALYAPNVHVPSREKMQLFLAQRRQRPRGPLIALAVAAAYGPAKEWPAAHFARLMDLLADLHGAECVLVGAPNERRKAEEVAAKSSAGAVVAAGDTTVGEALALLSLCSGFAGNDSGSMHVAGALGLPAVGIFGSTRWDRTGPLGPRTRIVHREIECSPCLKRTCRFGHYECLKRITPEDVLAALRGLGAVE